MMREALRHPLRFAGDHRFTRAQASSYLDHDLDTAGCRRVERHAGICPPCARFVASLRRTVTALAALRGTADPERGVGEDVIGRLRSEIRRGDTRDGEITDDSA